MTIVINLYLTTFVVNYFFVAIMTFMTKIDLLFTFDDICCQIDKIQFKEYVSGHGTRLWW